MQVSGKLAVLLIFSIGAAFLSCKSFGDPLMKIHGTVRDKQGNTVENATVSVQNLENGEIRKVALDQVTKADGVFDFGIVGKIPSNTRLVVKKEGFKTVEKEIISSEQTEIRTDIIFESQR